MSSDGNAFTNGMAAGQTWGRWNANRENEDELSDLTSQLRRYRARCKALEDKIAELDLSFVAADVSLARTHARAAQMKEALQAVAPNHPVLSPTVRDLTMDQAALERIQRYGDYTFNMATKEIERARK